MKNSAYVCGRILECVAPAIYRTIASNLSPNALDITTTVQDVL